LPEVSLHTDDPDTLTLYELAAAYCDFCKTQNPAAEFTEEGAQEFIDQWRFRYEKERVGNEENQPSDMTVDDASGFISRRYPRSVRANSARLVDIRRAEARLKQEEGRVSLRGEDPETLDSVSSASSRDEKELEDAVMGPSDPAVEEVSELVSGIEIGKASPGEEPVRPPILEPVREPIPLSNHVNFGCDRAIREKWLEIAQRAEERGELGDYDIYLINWFVVGDKGCFYEQGFKEIWEAVNDDEKLNMMINHSVDQYCRRTLDASESRARESRSKGEEPKDASHYKWLLQKTRVRHTVMYILDTAGRIASRARKVGQFMNHGRGGGKHEKPLASCHYACMEGIRDEFGISRNNRAILDVSAPILTVEPPHYSNEGHEGGCTILWNQFVLLDANEIVRLDDDPNPSYLGGLSRPSTPGPWGNWSVGGE
jgi:hypothetical protein